MLDGHGTFAAPFVTNSNCATVLSSPMTRIRFSAADDRTVNVIPNHFRRVRSFANASNSFWIGTLNVRLLLASYPPPRR